MITSIFEKPWLLLTVAAIGLVAAGFVCQIRPAWKRWPFLVPLLIAAAAFGMDRLVQTDTEQIRSVLSQCRRHAMERNIRKIEPYIADTYMDFTHRSKESLIRSIEARIETAGIERAVQRQHTLNIEGDTAVSQVRFRLHLNPKNSPYAIGASLMFVTLEIHYKRQTDGRWQIQQVLLKSVNDQPMGWKEV